MYRIALVNMPFGRVGSPSLALAQLRSLLAEGTSGADAPDVRIHNVNMPFAKLMGLPLYTEIGHNVDHLYTAVGEWLFQHVAFPDHPVDPERYFRRYYRGSRWEEFRTRVVEIRPRVEDFLHAELEQRDLASVDLLGFTSMFAQNTPSLALARLVKTLNPGVVTVMGGANCEAPMGQELVNHCPWLDFAFSGSALVNFPDLVRRLRDDGRDECRSLPGVLSRADRCGKRRADSLDLGPDLPMRSRIPVDFEDFFDDLERHGLAADVDPILPFETSRGCWWGERSHCTFCGLNGSSMTYRSLPPDQAVAEIRSVMRYYPRTRLVAGVDKIMPTNYPSEVLVHIDVPADMSIFYEVKADLDETEVATMALHGVRDVQPGIEALATSTLKLMGKGTTAFQNIRFLKLCVMYGLNPEWNLLVGFPGERADVYRKYLQVLPLLRHLAPPSGTYQVRFDRFSPYFMRPHDFGLRLRPMDSYALVYPFRDRCIDDVAYFFTDQNLGPYFEDLCDYMPDLQDAIGRWRAAWTAEPHPGLSSTVEEDGRVHVVDTRSDAAREYHLEGTVASVLCSLEQPANIEILRKRLPGERDASLVAALEQLSSLGLLFEEGGRHINLSTGLPALHRATRRDDEAHPSSASPLPVPGTHIPLEVHLERMPRPAATAPSAPPRVPEQHRA